MKSESYAIDAEGHMVKESGFAEEAQKLGLLPAEARAATPFLEELILACLAKQPELRPPDAGAMLQKLEEGWGGASGAEILSMPAARKAAPAVSG